MAEPEFKLDDSVTDRDLLLRIARELTTIRQLTSKAIFAMGEAEKGNPREDASVHELLSRRGSCKAKHVSSALPHPSKSTRKWNATTTVRGKSSTTSTLMAATSKRSAVR